ncbi:MAG TPA: hydroxyacid dehydrogenase [Clostridia bacterium]|nr:hydroxyacid dehydrogenase [Clostridia bacterium]
MKIALIAANNAQRARIFPPHLLEKLKAFGELSVNEGDSSPEAVKPVIKDADVVITSWGSPRMTEEYLSLAPNARLLLHAAGTVQPVVSEDVWKRGLRAICSSIAIGYGVAETALALAISASKNFYQLNDLIHAGGWKEAGMERVVDLVDITVGVLGAGMVGKHFIKLMKNFEPEIIVYDPYVDEETCKNLGVRKVSLEELLKQSDILSIHAPSIPETDNLINRETLALMKKDAGIINTARGSIVNEKDLYEHMAAGNLRFACLDVYNPEPPAIDNPLRRLSNVILLPHIAGVVNNGLARIGCHVIRELRRYENGEPSTNEIFEEMMFRVGKS